MKLKKVAEQYPRLCSHKNLQIYIDAAVLT